MTSGAGGEQGPEEGLAEAFGDARSHLSQYVDREPAVREWLAGVEQPEHVSAPTDDAADLARRLIDLRARARRGG